MSYVVASLLLLLLWHDTADACMHGFQLLAVLILAVLASFAVIVYCENNSTFFVGVFGACCFDSISNVT